MKGTLMNATETYSYDFLKRLAFPRFGGTEHELRAAHLLQKEISSLGGQSELQAFDIPAYQIDRASITVTTPFTRSIDCVAWGFSGQLPEGGAELTLRYIEMNSPVALRGLDDLSGAAVLVNRLDEELYQALLDRRAAAILEISSDKWYQADADLLPTELRPRFSRLGIIPTFTIRAHDATAMLRDGAKTVRLELRQRSLTATSHNVVATIEGTDCSDEWVAVTAHYDSMSITSGAWDNASGAATVMALYRHFLKNPPRRTMRFIWCGSEEQGLLGSKAYTARNAALMSSCRLCFNYDLCGSVLGENAIDLVGPEELETLVKDLCDQAGFPAYVGFYVDGSDSAHFAHHGIPVVCPSRGHWTSLEYHTHHDTMDTISSQKLHEMVEFSAHMISHFVNARSFPIPRTIPADAVAELENRYGPTPTL